MIDDRVGIQLARSGRRRTFVGYDEGAFKRSDAAYVSMGLERHPKKAKRGETHATFWGAEIDGSAGYVGAPRYKLAGLMYLLLVFASTGVTSIVTLEMVAGQLAYACGFRRPLLAALCYVYRQQSPDGDRHSKFRMHPWARNELSCLAYLLPLACSDLTVGFADKLFGADASLTAAGGMCSRASVELTKEMWRRCCKRPKHRGLLDPATAALRLDGHEGVDEVSSDESVEGDDQDEKICGTFSSADVMGEEQLHSQHPFDTVVRPGERRGRRTAKPKDTIDKSHYSLHSLPETDLGEGKARVLGVSGAIFWNVCVNHCNGFSEAFLLVCTGGPRLGLDQLCFVVIEICGGAGGISSACGRRNVSCGPVIEIKKGMDFLDESLFNWLIRLSLAGRIWVAILEPPCTTFSLARHPTLRDSSAPEGHDPSERKTHDGNLFAVLCLVLALSQWAVGNEFLIEQPGFGHMRFTVWWELLLFLGMGWICTPQCGYISSGPVYRKETIFGFCARSPYWARLYRACSCSVPHTKLEGSLTTAAAEYPTDMCEEIAIILSENCPAEPGPWLPNDVEGEAMPASPVRKSKMAGRAPSELHTIILSECMPWVVNVKHKFRKHGHINIQEAYAYRSILRRAPSSSRFVVLQDSLVNICVEAKGRSGSPALNRVVWQTWAEALARAQYPKAWHTPTWSLRADDPSRDKPIGRPKLAFPRWVWLLLFDTQDHADEAVAIIDRLPRLSRGEARWMFWTLSVADAADVVLGPSLFDEGAEVFREAERGHSRGASRRSHVGASPPAARSLRGVAGRADGAPPLGGMPAGSSPLHLGEEFWLGSLRRRVAAERLQGHDPCRVGLASMEPSGAHRCLASREQVGAAGADDPTHASAPQFVPSGDRGHGELGVAEGLDTYVDWLFRLIASGRDLRDSWGRLPEARRRPRASDSHPPAKAASGGSPAGVFEGGRGGPAGGGPEGSGEAAAWRSSLAWYSSITRGALAEGLGGTGTSAREVYTGVAPLRRGDPPLPAMG